MDTPQQRSPYGLIQEELRSEPWKLLVACVMLNLTNIVQVRPVIDRFFGLFPDPGEAAKADEVMLADLLRPLGLHNRRAKTIIKLSRAFQDGWTDVRRLPGVGKYAADSYKMFVEGSLDVDPADKKLRKYKEWAIALRQ